MRLPLLLALLGIACCYAELLVKDNTYIASLRATVPCSYHSRLSCENFYEVTCGGRLRSEVKSEQEKQYMQIEKDTLVVVRSHALHITPYMRAGLRCGRHGDCRSRAAVRGRHSLQSRERGDDRQEACQG